jgi:hypothetical protein
MLVVGRDVGEALSVEVEPRNLAELAQGIAHGSGENLEDGLLVFELDLGLSGMDVDVDVGRVDVYIYKIRYARACDDQSLVGLLYGLVEVGMLHEATVGEEILVGCLLAGRLRLADESADAAEGRVDADGQQVLA